MEEISGKYKRKFPLAVSFLILGILVIFALLLVRREKQSPQGEQQTVNQSINVTQATTAAYFKIMAANSSVKSGDKIELTVQADSDKQLITGFDLLVGYDQERVEFVSLESLDKNYQFFNFKSVGHLSVTASKNLMNKTDTALVAASILKLVFKAKTTGETTFSLMPKIGKEITTMVNNQSQKITPSVNDVQVYIE